MSTRSATDIDAADDLSFREDFDPVSTQEWVGVIESDLRGKSIDRLTWESIEGISLRPFYRSEDLDSFVHLASDPLPLVARDPSGGSSTTTAAMDGDRLAPGNPWHIRQEILDPTPGEATQRIRAAVEGGAESIGLPITTDAEDARGCHLPAPDALAGILQDGKLEGIPLHLDGSPWAVAFLPTMLKFYRNAGASNEAGASSVAGSVAFDSLRALLRGEASTPDPLFDLASDAIRTVEQAGLDVRTLNVDLRPFHDAGASAVQELAYAAGCLTEQLAILMEKGHRLSALVDALFVSVPVGTTYFIEIGKLRALRLLLARVLEAFAEEAGDSDVADFSPSDLVVHAHTSRRSETIYGPHVNLLRGSTEAAAAVLGGCDVLSVAPFDAVRSGPTTLSARLARNTPLMLRHESHLDQVADPGAGSYYIEAVTDALGHAAWDLFQRIEENGGLLESLADGWLHDAIAEVREQRLDQLDTRRHVLVGTTHYPDVDDEGDDIGPDPGATSSAKASPEITSQETSPRRASSQEAYAPPFDTISSLEVALQSKSSLREIGDAFQRGTPIMEPLPRIRLAEPFERLRRATESYHAEHAHRPTVLLAPIGPAGPRSARATFARNVLGVAGFRIVEPLAFDDAQEAAQRAAESEANIVVLCSSDERYNDLLSEMEAATTEQGVEVLVGVAGSPDAVPSDHDAPPAFFVHRHAPLLDTLRGIQSALGIDPVDTSEDPSDAG